MDEASHLAPLPVENAFLREQVASLEEKVTLLLQQQAGKAIKKNSHNSHNPPSQDKTGKVAKSRRPTSDRKSGGQQGHDGHPLQMVAVADRVIELRRNSSQSSGRSLPADQSVVSRRQIVDIPPVAIPIYQAIQAQLQQAHYVGSDETGARVQGKNWWVWVWQNAASPWSVP